MKKIFYISFFIFIAAAIQAQHLPIYSQYYFNDFPVNPAVAGSREWFDARTNHRYQWWGFTDAPRTFTVSVHGPNKKLNMGFGGYIFTDNVGPTRRTGMQLAYAYHLKLSKEVKLSLALSGGLLQYMVDGSKIILREQGDKVISGGLQWALVPDAKFAFYLYHKNWYLGGVIPQLMRNRLYFFDNQQISDSRLEHHYTLHGGYTFVLDDDFKIEPIAIVKYVKNIPVQFDITARAIYKDQVWLGGAFRRMDAWSMMIGYTYKNNLSIGYAHDFTTSNIRNYSAGTHELMLGIRFITPRSNSRAMMQ
jgi:type IX secretion system PorP/SprF family membrane protein